MKPIIQCNFKKVKDVQLATVIVNNKVIWSSTNEETILPSAAAPLFKITIKIMDGKEVCKVVKNLEHTVIKVRSNHAPNWMGLRGKISTAFMKLVGKEYSLKIKEKIK